MLLRLMPSHTVTPLSSHSQPGYNDVNQEIAENPKRRKEMKGAIIFFACIALTIIIIEYMP